MTNRKKNLKLKLSEFLILPGSQYGISLAVEAGLFNLEDGQNDHMFS